MQSGLYQAAESSSASLEASFYLVIHENSLCSMSVSRVLENTDKHIIFLYPHYFLEVLSDDIPCCQMNFYVYNCCHSFFFNKSSFLRSCSQSDLHPLQSKGFRLLKMYWDQLLHLSPEPGFQRQPGAIARRQFPHGGGYRLDTMDFQDDSRGWHFDMDMVIIYIYSVNWVIGFFIFCVLCYLFFPSF